MGQSFRLRPLAKGFWSSALASAAEGFFKSFGQRSFSSHFDISFEKLQLGVNCDSIKQNLQLVRVGVKLQALVHPSTLCTFVIKIATCWVIRIFLDFQEATAFKLFTFFEVFKSITCL